MRIQRLPADPEEAALRRYVAELWLPYNRDLAAAVDSFELADAPDAEIVDAEVEYRRDRLDEDDYRLWIVVDDAEPDDAETGERDPDATDEGGPDATDERGPTETGDLDLAETDGAFVGFIGVSLDESPPVFDRPDRALVCDLYVRDGYRGTGLADDLMDRAAAYARENDCSRLALEVDVDNERALGFYEKLGFEPYRHKMSVDVDEV